MAENVLEKIIQKKIQKIADLDISENFVLSEFLSKTLNKDYSSISKNFINSFKSSAFN